MRLFLNVSAVLVCGALAGVSALAQSAPRHAGVIVAAASTTADQTDAGEMPMRRSGGVEAHFDAANVTHDGRLTRAQADSSGWSRVLKHFGEIDTNHVGWISVDQIHTFNKLHRRHRKDAIA